MLADFLPGSVPQDGEFVLLAARIFLSSTYLAAETLVGGSLWYSMGTSAAGIFIALLLAGQRGRIAAGGRQ